MSVTGVTNIEISVFSSVMFTVVHRQNGLTQPKHVDDSGF